MRDILLELFEMYTTLAKQLFESLANTHQKKRPHEYNAKLYCYEWVNLDWPDDTVDRITLFDKQWDWDPHGEHCLFTCLDDADRTEVEANFLNYNIVDSGFFANFLETYPPALEVTSSIEVNYHTITDLLETYAKDGYLHQIDVVDGWFELSGANFIKV